MRILIIGGTSFFGLEVVKRLVREGHAVTVFTRGKHTLPAGLETQVSRVTGDRTVRADLARAAGAGPWDAVIDNIAFEPRHVAAALELFEGAGRYVLTSTASVYSWAPAGTSQPMMEESVDFEHDPPEYRPDDPGWAYAHGKVYAEKVLRERGEIPWTIIRPPIVLGPRDPTLRGHWYFARLIRGGPLLLADSGAASFRLAFSEDLAAAYLAALGTERAIGRTYNVAQPEIITLRHFLDASARTLRLEPEYVEVPRRFLERPHELGGPYAGMVNFIPSIERAQAELGYTATPFEAWLEQTVRWYRDRFDGDATPLLATRSRELAFAERWKQAIAPFYNEDDNAGTR